MTDWTAGYVADIGYTYGYYGELNPLRIAVAFLEAGLVPPDLDGDFAACELGFGQGMSVNIHAAAQGGHASWWATDFNPAQAAFAQSLAARSGAGARLFDQSFAEFCSRSDMPDFDSIGLHGIWSWISDDNRAVIVDFVRRKLRPGGVLYISYNTLPGWAGMLPMRHLLTHHAQEMGSHGVGIAQRVDQALAFADKLLAVKPQFGRAQPQVAERLKHMAGQSRNYLAHEYFNRDWQPMHFAEMAQWLAPAKLTHACSAHFLDHVDVLNLTPEQQVFLKEIPDAMFRETVRDFMVNQQFRRDYWVKGARKLKAAEQSEAWRQQKLLLITHRPDVTLKVSGTLGAVTMQEAVYGPLLDALADHKPQTLGQLEQAVKGKGVTFAQLLQAVVILTGAGHLAAVQADALIAKAKPYTDQLNASLIDKARGSGDISNLASPVTGGGVTVGRFQQLFLLAISQGKKQPAQWAKFVWQILAAQGQRLVKDGKTLETPDDNLAELTLQAQAFADKQLPIMKALGIA